MNAAKCCPNCGHVAPAAKRAVKGKRASKAIVLAGRNWPGQSAAYEVAMKVTRGELVWDEKVNAERFGARGDYVTPDVWLAHHLPLDELRVAVEDGSFESPRVAHILGERIKAAKWAEARPATVDARYLHITNETQREQVKALLGEAMTA